MEKGNATRGVGQQEHVRKNEIRSWADVAMKSGKCLIAFTYEDKKGDLQHRVEMLNFPAEAMPEAMVKQSILILREYDRFEIATDSGKDRA